MPAGKMDAFISDAPMSRWPRIYIDTNIGLTRITGINMPNLSSLIITSNPLTHLPYHDMTGLDYLFITGAVLGGVDISSMPKLGVCVLRQCGLVYADAKDHPTVHTLHVDSNSDLAWLDVSGCGALDYLRANNCNLPQSQVDQILADLVANGLHYGEVHLDGGNNAAPSQAGIDNANILAGRGWDVYTNAE